MIQESEPIVEATDVMPAPEPAEVLVAELRGKRPQLRCLCGNKWIVPPLASHSRCFECGREYSVVRPEERDRA